METSPERPVDHGHALNEQPRVSGRKKVAKDLLGRSNPYNKKNESIFLLIVGRSVVRFSRGTSAKEAS